MCWKRSDPVQSQSVEGASSTLVISLKFEPDPIRFGHVEKFKFAPYAVDLLDSFYRVQN
jgi:hypothetical protein